MVNDWQSPAAMLECLTPQWFVHRLATPLRLASSGQKKVLKDAPASEAAGVASNPMIAAGTWTGTKPKHMPKQSGIGDDNQVLSMVDCFTSGSSSDLNTPEIKLDDDLFYGTNITSDCNWEVKSEIAHAKNPDTVARSSIPVNQVLFDLSPATPDVHPDQPEYCMDFLRLSALEMEEGFVATGESCLALTSAPEEDILRPQPQPSPSDFLMDIGRGAEMQSELGIMNPKITSNPAPPQMSLDEACDFKIPTEILDQINKLFPDVLPVDNISSTELDMCLGMQGDLLSGAIEKSGVLKDEIFTATEESTQPEVTMEVTHSIFPDDTPMQVQSSSHDGITEVQAQNTYHEEVSRILAQSTSHEHDLACIQATKTTCDTMTHIQAQSSSHDVNRVQYLIPVVDTDGSRSVFTASKCADGSESLATCTNSAIPPLVVPSSKSVSPNMTSTVGPVRVKRQRRSLRKPLRFRDTVLLDDPVTAKDLSIVEYPESLVKEHTTTYKERLSQRQLTDREKYHRIRELNNEASKRCREKRKRTMKDMEEDMLTLEQRNRDLKAKEASLRKLRDKVQAFVNEFFKERLTSQN